MSDVLFSQLQNRDLFYSHANEVTALQKVEQEVFNCELKNRISHVFDILTVRERQIFLVRFGFDENDPCTQEATGRKFGVNKQRIQQIESRAIEKIRQSHGVEQLKSFYDEFE